MRRWVLAALLVGAALTLSGCGGGTTGSGGTDPTTAPLTFSTTTTTPTSTIATPTSRPYLGPNGFPIETGPFLAASTTTRLGAIIRGIQCEPLAQLAYTAYAHLQIYVDGSSRALPGGIGLVDENPMITHRGLFYGTHTCMYWLHTRAADGLIEAESPVPRHFTLGDFFAIWNQPLSAAARRRRARPRHGDGERKALARRSRSDPAHRARRDPAGGGQAGAGIPAGRLDRHQLLSLARLGTRALPDYTGRPWSTRPATFEQTAAAVDATPFPQPA